MRTQGILLVRDAILLLGVLPVDRECYASTPLVLWVDFNFTGSRYQTWALAAVM